MFSALTARHTFASGSELGPAATCGQAAHAGKQRSPASAAARPLLPAVAPALAPRSPRPRLLLPAVAPGLAPRSPRSRLLPTAVAPLLMPRYPRPRLLLPAVATALAPRSPRPRLSLPSVASAFAPCSLRPRVSRCRRLGLGDVFDQAGLMEQEEASVGVNAWALDSATREALGWCRGASKKTKRRATVCGPPRGACGRQRSTMCTEKDIRVGKQKIRRGIKKDLSLSSSCCYTLQSSKCEVYFRSPPGTIGACVSRKSLYLCGDTACT